MDEDGRVLNFLEMGSSIPNPYHESGQKASTTFVLLQNLDACRVNIIISVTRSAMEVGGDESRVGDCGIP